jgi:hypothetical protein
LRQLIDVIFGVRDNSSQFERELASTAEHGEDTETWNNGLQVRPRGVSPYFGHAPKKFNHFGDFAFP